MPDGGEHILLADDACAVADQVFQEIENLRLDRDQVRSAPQFAPLGVERRNPQIGSSFSSFRCRQGRRQDTVPHTLAEREIKLVWTQNQGWS